MWKLLIILPLLAASALAQSSASPTEYLCTADSLTVAPENDYLQDGTHSVLLNWTESSASVWFRVYRSTVSGGPYTRIADCISGLSYTDTTVQDGQTYFYVLTAVSQLDGIESDDSSQVVAQIPVYDTLTASVVQNLQVTIASTVTTSDSLRDTGSETRTPTESLSTSDALTRQLTTLRALAETENTSDSITIFSDGQLVLAETLATSDVISVLSNGQISLLESLSTSDAIDPSIGQSLTETISTSDSLVRTFAHNQALAQVLSSSDTLAAVEHGQRFYSQSLGESEAVSDSILAPVPLTTTVLARNRHVVAGQLGLSFTSCNANGGNSFFSTGREILLIENSGTSTYTLSLVSVKDPLARYDASLQSYALAPGMIAAIQMKYQAGWSYYRKISMTCSNSAIRYAVLQLTTK